MPVTLLSDALKLPAHASQACHVVLFVDQFPKVLGGGERVVLRTANLLACNGYRVSILTFAVLCAPDVFDGFPSPIYLLPVTSAFRVTSLGAAWNLGRFLRRENVRVVQTFFESSNLLGGIAVKLLSRAKLIWNRRDMGILRTAQHRFAYRWLRYLPDAIIAVSEQVRQHAIEVDGIPAGKVTVVYNGLDAHLWHPADSLPSGNPSIVSVGNIRAVKGHDVLIQAAAAVLQRYPQVHFVIAGEVLEPEFFLALQQSAAALGIADRVFFPGALGQPQELLQTASIFVLPSRSEGFSNAIVEAMLTALPVVATTVGGNAEAVVQGETGLLVPPDDPAALAAALLLLLDDAALRGSMGRAGRQRAEALFSEAGTLQRTIAVFDQVLGTQTAR